LAPTADPAGVEEVRMGAVAFDGVSKVYADGTRAVSSMDLEIEDREFVVLVGPSGCGKTTALRMVAGLEEISDGTVRIGDRIVNDLTPRERDIAMVFQSYALYPHLSVYDNIAFSLRLHKVPKAEIDKRVHDAARILDLEPYLKRKPKALSGGQRQRVAMGRAIVRQPSAFLMDEPLSNLDAKLRVQMRAEISELQRNLGVTTIYVTHDQVEAMTMGDRVAVMRKGELQQAAEPQELYDRPVNLFVAGFIGSPAMNLLEATLQRDNGTMKVVTGSQEIALGEETLSQRPALRGYEGREIVLGIRPEDLEDSRLAGETALGGTLEGTVTLREALGAEIMVHFSVAAPPAFTADVKELAEDIDAERAEARAGESSAVLVGRFGARSRVKPGEQIDVAVDTRQLHFFDVETGLGIYGDGA
jgi:multiple sugar transport system ATP-binding protein